MTDLETKLAAFLKSQDLTDPNTAAVAIMRWMVAEYDRQIEQALGPIRPATRPPVN
jgi:hypothetical protein